MRFLVCNRKISDSLYRINEHHYWEWNLANLWLIKGKTQDLLIDTGLGVASLRQHIAILIDKPLLAIASHIHYDHAGEIHEFDRIAIHPAEAEALRQGDAEAALCTPEGERLHQQNLQPRRDLYQRTSKIFI